jgi:tRNA (mo5U34)-methyltransferase
MSASDDVARLREEVTAIEWYHTLELRPGVVTPGWFDLRPIADLIPWPQLEGRRCLDVGTFDGFWAFEMERRGASEVLAIDLIDPGRWDWPYMPADEVVTAIAERKGSGRGFEIARDARGSSVQRLEMSVYDLDPGEVGTFDLVYVGSLLLHLRDPIRALERVRTVCRSDAIFVDAIDLWLTTVMPRRPVAYLDGRGRPWWWKPNLAAFVRMVEDAGFRVIDNPRRLYMPPGAGQPRASLRPDVLRSRAGRNALMTSRKGDPHAAIRATPL